MVMSFRSLRSIIRVLSAVAIGRPGCSIATASCFPCHSEWRVDFSTGYFAVFTTADWNVRPRCTFNLLFQLKQRLFTFVNSFIP